MSDLPSMLHDLVEGAVSPLDVDAIVARRRAHRRRQRLAGGAALLAVVAASATVATLAVRSSRSRHEQQVRVVEGSKQQTVSLESSLASVLLVSPGGGTGAMSGPLDHVVVTDPLTGAARRESLPLPTAQSSLYPYVGRGRFVVVVLDSQTGPYAPAIGTAYAVSSTFDRQVRLGPASYAFASVDAARVWLTTDNATPDQRLHGVEFGTRRTVQEVDLEGRATSPEYALPDRRTPIAAVRGGLLTDRPAASSSALPILEVWDPATGRVLQRFAAGASAVAASDTFVVWTVGDCGLKGCALHATDLRSGSERVLTPPRGMVWQTSALPDTQVTFSSDGAHLAVLARPPLTPEEAGRLGLAAPTGSGPALVAVVDLATGARSERRLDAWKGPITPGWSPDGNVVFLARDAAHVTYFAASDMAGALHVLAVSDAGDYLVVERPPPPAGTTAQQRYEVDAMVLEDAQHGPELCVYPVASVVTPSSAPGCAGPPVVGWDWSKAPDPQRAAGTTYGKYHLVGTYDGAAFTLTEPPAAYREPSARPQPDVTTPCPTPPGGWRITNPSRVRSIDDFNAFRSAAQSSAEYAGIWIDLKTPTKSAVTGFGIVNVAFTGGVDAHRLQLAALWGGPLCVLQRPHAYSELEKVRDELAGAAGQKLGLQIITVGPDDAADTVGARVIAATPATQRAVDGAYDGVVHIESVLRPLP
jgi:hypothetical protein